MAQPDRFFAIVQLCDNLMRMHNNMRENIRIIQAAHQAGTLKVPVAQALQDLGKAFQQRLVATNDAIAVKHPGPFTITAADVGAIQAFLKTYADGLATSTASDAIGVKNHVDEILLNIPEVTSVFV